MSNKYSFRLKSQDPARNLPEKVVIGQQDTETVAHVLLKMFAFILFHRERIQIEQNLHMDTIPFVPDIVQLDYQMRPKLWVECGDCSVTKLNRLAVKVPEAEIWVVKRSEEEVQHLMKAMRKAELRKDRYRLVALDSEMFDEVCGTVAARNDVFWVQGEFEPPGMQFDFNGLWFDSAFSVFDF
ncbi:MAG: YaeQ family protein [Verrucomicrobia bacterium]|jgi:uncharacterized protein YaeQ|nr:YaeQ family protein [Verrucomicrobiota bacterium]